MAEAPDTHEFVAALDDDDDPLTINDLPNDMLVSIFIAVEDPFWVRHNVPHVCKAWDELYRSQDASPLHELLSVDFEEEVLERATARDGVPRRGLRRREKAEALRLLVPRPIIHDSRVIARAERPAGSVRKLRLKGEGEDLVDFSPEDLGALVAVVGSSLTELLLDWKLYELYKKPFWESLRDYVVPAGRLHSFAVGGKFGDDLESDVEPLGQLAGSLEELKLNTYIDDPDAFEVVGAGLRRFPESLFALTELRRLVLVGHLGIAAIPAKISFLKKLEEITLAYSLSSLAKELCELSGLTKFDLQLNENLGNTLQEEVFPAELGKINYLRHLNLAWSGLHIVPAFVGELKSLRALDLRDCGLRTVPAFIGELESLEFLDLSENDFQVDATALDFLIGGCPRLREVRLNKRPYMEPWTPESLAHLESFKAKLLAENPNL